MAVTFQDSGRYLTISDTARLCHDPDKITKLWNESWKVWFPKGQHDPELALIHIEAIHGEYWDNGGFNGLSYAIRAGKAYWEGETPDIPQEMNAKVSLG